MKFLNSLKLLRKWKGEVIKSDPCFEDSLRKKVTQNNFPHCIAFPGGSLYFKCYFESGGGGACGLWGEQIRVSQIRASDYTALYVFWSSSVFYIG